MYEGGQDNRTPVLLILIGFVMLACSWFADYLEYRKLKSRLKGDKHKLD